MPGKGHTLCHQTTDTDGDVPQHTKATVTRHKSVDMITAERLRLQIAALYVQMRL